MNSYRKNHDFWGFFTANWFKIFCVCVSAVFVLVILHQLFIVQPNIIESLDAMNDLSTEFPLRGISHTEMMDNSNMHFRYHESRLDMISVLVASIAALLTFIAFYVQYIFNRRQSIDIAKERYENQFFHMMDVYRAICNSTVVPNVGSGKIAFHYMFYEYKAIANKLDKSEFVRPDADSSGVCREAFSMFLDGASASVSPPDNPVFNNYTDAKSFYNELLALQERSEHHDGKDVVDCGVPYIRDYCGRNVKYFDGHRLRLIPYFKYIMLILDYLAKNMQKMENSDFDALPFLYSEMSEHEIGLLYAYASLLPEATIAPLQEMLDRIYSSLPSENADRFKFDNISFIRTQRTQGA